MNLSQSPRQIALHATIVLCSLLTACDPVVPIVEFDDWQFEGYQVYSHVPENPLGMVFVFHGSYGSANFANKIETVDVLNELLGRGYGFVATEATLRTGNKRWVVNNPSFTTNADLARLARLYDELLYTTAITVDTPIFGIGMSNGARMVTLFGQSFADAGYLVAAIAPFMGTVATPVRLSGGLTVPTFFLIAENDSTAPNPTIINNHATTTENGTPAKLFIKREEALLSARFTRIPAVSEAQAEQIYQALLGTGGWNSDGQRLLPIDDVLALVGALTLPPALVPSRGAIRNQVKAMLAVHQFIALYKLQLADFFDEQLP